MTKHLRALVFGTIGLCGVWIVSASGQTAGQSTGQPAAGPAVKPAAVEAKAGTPPPATATTTTDAGKNKVKVPTGNSASDSDSAWVEKIDIDGDGDVEDSNLVWDDEDKVLFAYASGAMTCRNGGTATGDLLIATYAEGNSFKRPAGSGFWVADLDAGEGGAQAAGLWGCKFDAKGNNTTCGVAVLDAKNDDIVIARVAK